MGLSKGCFYLLRVYLSNLVTPLPHQEGMISQPELGRPVERREEVPSDHVGHRPIRLYSPSRVRKGNLGLFDQKPRDLPPRDLCHGPLKEGQEEDVPQCVLHYLEVHPNVRGDVLHEVPLLVGGLLQARVCGLQVPTRHPRQGGHNSPLAVHLLPHPAILRRLDTNETPKVTSSCHYLEAVAPEEGLRPYLLRVYLSNLVTPLPHQEGMISQPELGRPVERREEVPSDHVGHRPIRLYSPSRVRKGNLGLFDQKPRDLPPRDLCHGPLKEGQEEDVPQCVLHYLEVHPNVRGDVLHEVPLLVGGLLQARVCGLQVPTRHPRQGGHNSPLAVHLLPHPAILRRLDTNETPKVTSSCHYLEAVAPEEGLRPRDVPERNDQDSLCRLREVALRGPSHHKVIQVLPDPLKGAACPSVIRIPGLGDARVGFPQFADKREDSQPIFHHRQWGSLGHSLLAEKEVTLPIARPYHQRGLVAVAVECEPNNTGPLELHF